MNSIKTFAAALLLTGLSTGAFAESSNGADGWHKLQEAQQVTAPSTQASSELRVNADNYAAEAIAANPSNYNTR